MYRPRPTQANRRWILGHCRHVRWSHRTVATSSGPRAHDHTTELAPLPGHGRPGTLTTIGCVRWPAPRVAGLPADLLITRKTYSVASAGGSHCAGRTAR